MRTLLKIIALAAIALPAFCMTTVLGTLYTATGGYCSGTMTISWQTFVAPDGHTVYGGSAQSAISAGPNGLIVVLEPGQYSVNLNIVPAGCTAAYEQWLVPDSATPVPLSAVRSINPPLPFQTVALGLLSRGAAVTGQALCWLGTAWGPGTCGGSSSGVSSVFGRSGAVAATSGDYTTAQVTESGNLYFTAGRAQAAMAGLYQTPISGAPSTWPTLGTAAAHAATDFQVALTAYSTISGLSGYPSTFPPVNSGNWAGTWQGNAPSAFEPALGNPGTGGYCLQSTTGGVRSWGPCGSGGGASSQGAANNLNVSDGSGAFLSTPLSVDHTTGAISGPSTAPMLIQGVHQSASGLTTPATNQDALVFDLANSDHLTRKDSAGALHDIEASGGGSSGWPVGSTPSVSPSTGTYSSTQSATASCSHGTAYYCLGTLGFACSSGATVTAYSAAVSVASSARFQAQCRDGGYDPGAIGYSDLTITSGGSAPTYAATVCTGDAATYGTGVATCAVTGATTGKLIVLTILSAAGSTISVTSVSDGTNLYNTANASCEDTSHTNYMGHYQYYGYAVGSAFTLTVTFSDAYTYRGVLIAREYDGAALTGVLDTGSSAHSCTSGSVNAGTPFDLGGVTTSAPNELIVCGLSVNDSAYTYTVGSGWGNLQQIASAYSGGASLASQDRTAATAAAYTTLLTYGSNTVGAGGCAAYKGL